MKNVYGADTETDYFITDDGSPSAFIVQYCISDGETSLLGETPHQFVGDLLTLSERHSRTYVYFHNLSFDIEFYLVELRLFCDALGVEPFIIRRGGKTISFTISWKDASGKGRRVVLRDSSKKYPTSLKRLGDMIGLPKLDGPEFKMGWSKDIDWDDPSVWDYVKRDAEIVAVAMKETHRMGNSRATKSGDAIKHAKDMIGCYPNGGKWARYFPRMPYKQDSKLRRAYFGGINLSLKKGLIEGDIKHLDVVSMYPAVMCFDPLPWGLSLVTDEKPDNEDLLYIKTFRCKLRLRDGMVPWFTFKQRSDLDPEGLTITDHVVECKEWHVMTLTCVDLKNLERTYHIEVDESFEPIYYVFRSEVGLLKNYVHEFMDRKEKAKKGSLAYNDAKLMMNSLYGRIGLSPVGEDTSLVYMDGPFEVGWETVKTTLEDNDAYVPYSLFVTAHARRRLMDAVNAVGRDNMIHSDTDSIIFLGDIPEEIELGDGLGQWEVEAEPVRMWEGGFKRYVEYLRYPPRELKDVKIACSGVTKNNGKGIPGGMCLELYDDPSLIVDEGYVLGNPNYTVKSDWIKGLYEGVGVDWEGVNTFKLQFKRVPGGAMLADTTFKISSKTLFKYGMR